VWFIDAAAPGRATYADMVPLATPDWPSGYALDNITRCWSDF
jgi:hypothetical protein